MSEQLTFNPLLVTINRIKGGLHMILGEEINASSVTVSPAGVLGIISGERAQLIPPELWESVTIKKKR